MLRVECCPWMESNNPSDKKKKKQSFLCIYRNEKIYYTAYNTITFLPAVLFNNYLPTKFT